jgi:OOP family OmpA-OmpF porin
MNKMKNVALLFATAILATSAAAQTVDNWRNGDNQLVWKNGTNELCWRDANWTPSTAAPGCDDALAVTPLRPAANTKLTPSAKVPAPLQPAVSPTLTKVTYAADAFFDFDKSFLKPQGKEHLDRLLENARSVNLDVIIAVGHTDSVGTDLYNQKLSLRRSEAVKAYLISKGIDKTRVFTEGKGETNPVADNRTAQGRAKNRRVEIQVVGSRTSP